MLLGAHRGNSEEWPENTLAAFRSAVGLGVDAIECDVHLSADGRPVVIHDPTLERTTNGRGAVRDRPWAELRRLDAGGGERLPLLDEVCEVVGDTLLFVELKQPDPPYDGLERTVVDTLRRAGRLDSACVISFDHALAGRVKRLEPGLEVGLITTIPPPDPASVLREHGAGVLSPHLLAVDPALTAAAHAAGAAVSVWTVDAEDDLRRCQAAGVDSIVTNRPAAMLPLLSGRPGRAPSPG
jgi:glycerophosphoryl diester phosphodiesterase